VAEPAAERLRVWDPAVRAFHWTLVTGIAVAWITGEGWPRLHDTAGYAVLAAIAFRLAWGVFGPAAARFGRFVRGVRATRAYAAKVLRRAEPRYLGHNPLGAWMIVALLATAFGAGITGWLYTTDRFWGVAWMEALHEGLAWLLLGLIALHLGGVAFTSLRQGENLVAAMIHGDKPRRTKRHPEDPVGP